jgi:hypothetical protein
MPMVILTDVIEVFAGEESGCAIHDNTNLALHCWGENEYGEANGADSSVGNAMFSPTEVTAAVLGGEAVAASTAGG